MKRREISLVECHYEYGKGRYKRDGVLKCTCIGSTVREMKLLGTVEDLPSRIKTELRIDKDITVTKIKLLRTLNKFTTYEL